MCSSFFVCVFVCLWALLWVWVLCLLGWYGICFVSFRLCTVVGVFVVVICWCLRGEFFAS